jgi:Reverse transcriptase (RNA-dependent DNA polymerase)
MSCCNQHVASKTFAFVQAFSQAPSESELYIDVPKGCTIDGERDEWALKVVNNIYGQKQAGRVWYKYRTTKLVDELHFQQSKYDPCVLWRDRCILVVYTDDTIITGPSGHKIDIIIKEISDMFKITSEDIVNDFLGINIDRREDGTIVMTQPKLIQDILDDLGLKDNSVSKDTPALSSSILQPMTDEVDFDEKWNYRSILGKLNYLEKSTRPDIAYAVHQCARFASCPKIGHGIAVKHIGRYLLSTKDKGIICTPTNESVDCCAGADFSGNWNSEIAATDKATARCRSGYVIKYAGVPVTWGSKLQTKTALSATEAEYIALSTALREGIPIIDYLQELSDHGFKFNNDNNEVLCKAFRR